MSEVVIQAPRRGEIPRVQIADLCEGCISLSNAEGFGERLFHFSYIIGIEEFPIVKDTTPNMMNPRLYTTSYNKPQGQQFDDTAVLSFIKLQYT